MVAEVAWTAWNEGYTRDKWQDPPAEFLTGPMDRATQSIVTTNQIGN